MTTVTTKQTQNGQKDTLHTEERATVDIKTAARILGLGRNQVYTAARNGELPVVRIGKRILVSRVVLDRLLRG